MAKGAKVSQQVLTAGPAQPQKMDRIPISTDVRNDVGVCMRAIDRHEILSYYFPALLRLKFFKGDDEMSAVAAVAKDGTCFINEKVWRSITPRDRARVLIHETMHCLHKHHDRMAPYQPNVRQVATYIVVNHSLTQSGLVPLDGEINESWLEERGIKLWNDVDRMSAEQIADILPPDILPPDYDIDYENAGSGNRESSKDGQTVEVEVQEIDWDEVAAHCYSWAQARGQGTLPAGALIPSTKREAKMDWRPAFWRHTINGQAGELSFRRPTRRLAFLSDRFIIPGPIGVSGNEVWIIDVSGSVCGPPLEQFLGEVDAARKMFNTRVYLILIDADVEVCGWLEPEEPFPAVMGGGGSDLRPAFEHVMMEVDDDYSRIVVLTDGYVTWPDSPPDGECFIVWTETPPPWGTNVKLEID